MDIKEAGKIVEAAFREAMNHHVGDLPTREEMEKTMSDALGFPCQLPNYDKKTSTLEVVLCPPIPLNYIDITIVLDEKDAPSKKDIDEINADLQKKWEER
jgi:hypothetical protein